MVARQAIGAILNLEASFQCLEDTADIQTVQMSPGVPGPTIWAVMRGARASIARERADGALPDSDRTGLGSQRRMDARHRDLGEDELLHRCWIAYMSDDMPADAVRNANPEFKDRTASRSSPASTTPSGSTVRYEPITGISTT